MAINKRKILQSAQKHLQKGALDKALKDYKTLLDAEPKDVNLRLKVGDIHLKQGKGGEAAAAYEKVAERFMKDGFDAKAVALYKQITKIDPKRFEVYVPLSELYQRLGLKGDAMEALQTAADARYKEGDKPGALDLLRKMAGVDPSNTTNRTKVAELLRQEGMNEEAISEYEAVAEELGRQGDVEGRSAVLEKVLELDANRPESLLALGRCHVERRRFEDAEAISLRLVSEFSEHAVEGYEILTEVMTGQGREGEELTTAYRNMAHALRDRGDDERAQDILQRYAPVSALSVDPTDAADLASLNLEPDEEQLAFDAAIGAGRDCEESGVGLDAEQLITDSGLRLGAPSAEFDQVDGTRRAGATASNATTSSSLPPLPSLAEEGSEDSDPDALEFGDDDLELEEEVLSPSVQEAAEAPAEAPAPAPAGGADVEQLLAEASVYTRYGKHDRAVESLRGVLAQEPDHILALEKLAESLDASGDRPNAVEALLRAGRAARAAGDEATVATMRMRVEALDESAAAELEPPGAEPEAAHDEGIEIDVDDDFDLEEDDGAAISEDAEDAEDAEEAEDETGAFAVEPDVGEDDSELELELELTDAAAPDDGDAPGEDDDDVGLDLGSFEDAMDDAAMDAELGAGMAGEEAGEPPASEDDAADELAFEQDSGAPASGEAADAPESEIGQADKTIIASSTSTAQEEIRLDLEEADFFHAQGMLDEAEAVYQRILERAPSHPQAMVRLGELEAMRADEAPAQSEAGEPAARSDDDATGEFEVDLGDEPEDLVFEDEVDDEPEADATPPSEPDDALADAPQVLLGSDTTEVEEFALESPEPDPLSEELEAGLDSVEPAAEQEPEAAEAEPDEEPEGLEAAAQPEAEAASDAESQPEPEPEPEPVSIDAAAHSDAEVAPDAEPEPEQEPEQDAVEMSSEFDADADSNDAPAPEPDPGHEAETQVRSEAVGEPEPLTASLDSALPDLTTDSPAPTGPLPQAALTDPGLGAFASAAEGEAGDAGGADIMDGEFDLAAELSNAFEDDAPSFRGTPQTTEEEGFEQVFAAFKRGVDEQLDDEDYQARYDLGIAYKEMGLLDDAIGEFRSAMADGGPAAACLHMMGLCALDLGRADDGVAHLEQALSGPEIPDEQQMALRFDLGRGYQAIGDLDRARSAYEAVAAVDAEFCDVSRVLEALDDPPPAPAVDEDGEAFESFDDLLADESDDVDEADEDDTAAAEEAKAEAYESFDDLMDDDAAPDEGEDDAEIEPEAEAEPAADDELVAGTAVEAEGALDAGADADAAEAEDAADADADAEPEPEPEPEPVEEPEPAAAAQDEPGSEPDAEEAPKPKRRKKKISFL